MLQNAFANLATDQTEKDLAALLRRLLKLMESNATVDSAQRQRIVIDALAGGITLSTVTTVTSVSNVAAIAGETHRMFIDIARTAYNTGIRSKLN